MMKGKPPHKSQKQPSGDRIAGSGRFRGRFPQEDGMPDIRTAVVIAAHPDDETLWAGGTILMHPGIQWTVATLCRKSDSDRAPKFKNALSRLRAAGTIGDLDDGPEQSPLSPRETETAILSLLSSGARYDLVLTHSLFGEYTRHRRHEETGHAVLSLWSTGRLKTGRVWLFAYEDGNKRYLPRAIETAHRMTNLPDDVFNEKYRIITEVYGFAPDSWEARTVPRTEAFFCFRKPRQITEWYERGGII
jgi:hypothetical protein